MINVSIIKKIYPSRVGRNPFLNRILATCRLDPRLRGDDIFSANQKLPCTNKMMNTLPKGKYSSLLIGFGALLFTHTAYALGPCPEGSKMDMYGVQCIRAHCPPGFKLDPRAPEGCAPLFIPGGCHMNCKPMINLPAPDGRQCPPCPTCPKSTVQVCGYFSNQCRCRDH